MTKKEPLTIKELAKKLVWRFFGNDEKYMRELQFIMGRNGNKANDTVEEVLEDILRNV